MIMPSSFATVAIHPSQFPDQVYQDYLDGFRAKAIDHRFHYDSVKQSQKWLKIHKTYSPASGNEDCLQAYTQCFKATEKQLTAGTKLQLIALGCGGGAKDSRLLSGLLHHTQSLICYPIDVSLSLALISAQAMQSVAPDVVVKPVVCNLLAASDLIQQIDQQDSPAHKVITFFGMIPNFFPNQILPILSQFLSSGDHLLFSANLAPGPDYIQGIQTVLPQYDNDLTRDWLMTILIDVGVETSQGCLTATIESDETYPDISRIAFYFEVKQAIQLTLDEQLIHWDVGDRIRLFFSYRYTSAQITALLQQYGIKVLDFWEDDRQEEGVYLCQKEGA